MNFNQISYFLKLAEVKSFSLAAQQLYISQPTLSQQIKALEVEFNVTLFVRTKRKEITLTPEGQDFLYYAQRIESNVHGLNIAIGKYCSLDKGSLRIGLLWTFGYAQIDKLIDQFTQTYPQISVSIQVDGSVLLAEKINNDDLDVAFVTESVLTDQHAQIDRTLINQSDLGLIVNKNHLFARRPYITAEDLNLEKILMVSRNSNIYPELSKSFQVADSHPVVIGESSQADVVCQIADAGIAVGFLSYQAYEYIHNTKITFIPYVPTIKRSIYLISKMNTTGNKIVKVFNQAMIEALSTDV